MTPKQCLSCNQVYPATTEFFYKDKTRPSGLHVYCKSCQKQKAKQRRIDNIDSLKETARKSRARNYEKIKIRKQKYAKEHPEYERERSRKRREKDPEGNRKYQREWAKERYQESPEKGRTAAKKWRDNNPEKAREIDREWRKRNPLKVRAKGMRRTARKKNAEGVYTGNDVQKQYQLQKGKCYWCHKKVDTKYHVDHVIPLAKGGTNWPSNIVIACPYCNQSKGCKLPHEWHGSGGRMC